MENFLKQNWFKIITVLILVYAFWDHPYSYYQILRWFTTICSAYLAYKYSRDERMGWMWVFIATAILFNPIYPFYFSKEIWKILDLIGAGIFSIAIFIKKNNKTI